MRCHFSGSLRTRLCVGFLQRPPYPAPKLSHSTLTQTGLVSVRKVTYKKMSLPPSNCLWAFYLFICLAFIYFPIQTLFYSTPHPQAGPLPSGGGEETRPPPRLLSAPGSFLEPRNSLVQKAEKALKGNLALPAFE